jgi:hypothetical protein
MEGAGDHNEYIGFDLPRRSFEHPLTQMTILLLIELYFQDPPFKSREKQTNASITLAGRAADPLWPHPL